MSYTDPNYLEADDDNEGTEDSNNLRNLRAKAKQAEKLERENAELRTAKRELEFLKAGVDVSTPIGQMFAKGYDGDPTAEAIKEAWEALGATSSTEIVEEGPSEDELASTRERQALAAGAAGDTGETPPAPVRGKDGKAVRAALDAVANGAPRDDALGVAFSTLVGAAASGDQSVILPREGGNPA